jgi:2-polyprenyl-3-methyl-5-hydroxy-6-metoxy-1,4-benzoquinol methylase
MSAETEDADVETSSAAYARRFSGAVGAFFLETQARATLDLLAPFAGASVLEVGGGHGQLAGHVAGAGHALTVFGSDPSCIERVKPLVDAGRVRFESGELLALPHADRAFDVVMAFRLLPHVRRWPQLVSELARVARRAVIVDYPTTRSVNVASSALFGMKKGVEGDTRPFHVFRDAELAEAFSSHGLRESGRRPQFFFPMALHRALRIAALSRALEGLALATGLVGAFGSPVVLRLERHG